MRYGVPAENERKYDDSKRTPLKIMALSITILASVSLLAGCEPDEVKNAKENLSAEIERVEGRMGDHEVEIETVEALSQAEDTALDDTVIPSLESVISQAKTIELTASDASSGFDGAPIGPRVPVAGQAVRRGAVSQRSRAVRGDERRAPRASPSCCAVCTGRQLIAPGKGVWLAEGERAGREPAGLSAAKVPYAEGSGREGLRWIRCLRRAKAQKGMW